MPFTHSLASPQLISYLLNLNKSPHTIGFETVVLLLYGVLLTRRTWFFALFLFVWWTSSSTTFCPVKLWSCGVDRWADADEYDRCLSMFRYIGIKQATFAPLGSLGNRSSDSFGSSPKSMYRLAHMVRKLSYGAQINIRQLKPTPLHCSLKYPKHEISPWRI